MVCYGYPPSAYNQNIYTGLDSVLRKSNIPQEEVERLRAGASLLVGMPAFRTPPAKRRRDLPSLAAVYLHLARMGCEWDPCRHL